MTAPVSTLSSLVPEGEALHVPMPGYSRADLCPTSARVSKTPTSLPPCRSKQHDVPGFRKSPTRHRTSPHTTGTAVECSTAAWRGDLAASVACLPLAPPTPTRRRCRRLSTIERSSGASCRTVARSFRASKLKDRILDKKASAVFWTGHEQMRCFDVFREGCGPRASSRGKQRCLCSVEGRGSIQAPSGFSRASHHGGDERDKWAFRKRCPEDVACGMTKI